MCKKKKERNLTSDRSFSIFRDGIARYGERGGSGWERYHRVQRVLANDVEKDEGRRRGGRVARGVQVSR